MTSAAAGAHASRGRDELGVRRRSWGLDVMQEQPPAAIGLHGFVKRFGALTTVDGWTSRCSGAGSPRTPSRRAPRAPARSTGPPRARRRSRASPRRGWATRRTGTSVSVLGANGADGLGGERRITRLEDVFVLLTGEEIR